MKRIFLSLVPSVLSVLASKFDGIKLPEPQGATEYSEGPMSFLTCGFPGLLDSSLRVLMFRPIEGVEYACHARLSFRPMSSSADLMTIEFDFEALVDLFRGTGVRTIDAAGKLHFAEFYSAMDSSFMSAFRNHEGEIRLTEGVVVLPLRRAA
jgi:hypothetical protein